MHCIKEHITINEGILFQKSSYLKENPFGGFAWNDCYYGLLIIDYLQPIIEYLCTWYGYCIRSFRKDPKGRGDGLGDTVFAMQAWEPEFEFPVHI